MPEAAWRSLPDVLSEQDDERYDQLYSRRVPYTKVPGNPLGDPKPCPVEGCDQARINGGEVTKHLRRDHDCETQADVERLNRAHRRLAGMIRTDVHPSLPREEPPAG